MTIESLSGLELRALVAARAVTGIVDATVTVRRKRGPNAMASTPDPGPAVTGPPAHIDGLPLRWRSGAPRTLQAALARAAAEPGRGLTYLQTGQAPLCQTYEQLRSAAGRIAAGLRLDGLPAGAPVILQTSDNRSFLTAFWACVVGGFVPLPVAVPPSYTRDSMVVRRLRHAWEQLGHPLVLTDDHLQERVAGLRRLWDVDDVRTASVDRLGDTPHELHHPVATDDTALFLLTSGSTGAPKIVRHTHQTLCAFLETTAQAHGLGPDQVTLNWMPLDHVGGIVMSHLRDVGLGCEQVIAGVDDFLGDPLRWLDWAHEYRATSTWAPNFAFSLVNRALQESSPERQNWDLSTLRFIGNGGEAVVAATAHRFLQLLAPYGLPPDAIRPVWGMSETSSGVVFSTLSGTDSGHGVVTVDKHTLTGQVREIAPTQRGATTLVEVGVPVPGVSVRIVDEKRAVLPEGWVGRLEVRGATVMPGYHGNTEANAVSYADGWFSTGDLALVRGGRLIITGREKDTLVIRGANYLCFEIEAVVGEVEGVLPTYAAACAEPSAAEGTDQLVVFCAVAPGHLAVADAVAHRVSAHVAKHIGLRPGRVIAVDAAEFRKTPSGKVQRGEMLADLYSGRLAHRELPADENTGDPEAPWLYEPVWQPLPAVREVPAPGVHVVLAAQPVVAHLRSDVRLPAVIGVSPGTRWSNNGDDYTVRPGDSDDLAALLADVRRRHGPIAGIVHGWTASPAPVAVAENLRLSAYTLCALLAAVEKASATDVRVLVVSRGAYWVRPGDRVSPCIATLEGLVRTASAERACERIRLVDLPPAAPRRIAEMIVTELTCADEAEVVAVRDNMRLTCRIRPLDSGAPATPGSALPMYLLAGGAGGIGIELARSLAADSAAVLLVTGRNPDGERLLRERVTGPAVIEYHVADVTDPTVLGDLVADAERRHGRRLTAVHQLAGADVIDHWRQPLAHTLTRETPEELTRMLRPKVYGTLALAEILNDRPQTLLVLCSSVIGHFGAVSFGGYAAANSFLRGFADYWGRELGRPVRYVAWSQWRDTGMNRDGDASAATRRGFRDIPPAHGVALLQEIVSGSAGHVLAGLDDHNERLTSDLDPQAYPRLEVVVRFADDAARPVDPARLHAAVHDRLGDDRITVRVERRSTGGRATARTSEASLSGAGESDGLVAGVIEAWRSVLGQSDIGPGDDFFEVGGTSLDAARLIDKINSGMGIRLSTHDLYENPTAGDLSRHIESVR
ncbi:SDR family NAD(P)-dependent oxidoreductase [Actinoplanes xinjiangensis]|uniref:Acyl-CoA synthetase (AMP-forming)/AMP-acid ligase II n=1 Tax=Actinoplanes xinjiangensis TaxID=512350 RepID=A0A316ETW2_9ACTN|nr:SDR family NAD(P)-dependent oxidoreductase [Actinoplanes xinjiangensis]PWK36084.1 acyl-CoA synthetase (AMP-forming)/AMP-acid ligase II [Actinoplanes xinjiangensis]GIF42912.1 hypothetical protein Axi01nite_72230 [Actinoplanes xinjiangensis]